MTRLSYEVESEVRERYSAAARERADALCCPVSYPKEYLKAIPQEVIDRDYGCGDPSQWVSKGETVLDLGSGGGKICFIASQIVGPEGRVIGVDMNDDMLALARRSAPMVAEKTGYANTVFLKGRIQDLRTDRERLGTWLAEHPVRNEQDLVAFEAFQSRIAREEPLIADQSVDVVVSNCVLNLVSNQEKTTLFAEIHRVLKRGGRAVISDIVADEAVPAHLQDNPELWSGCISGAFVEQDFLKAFAEAGFYGIELAKRDETPWRVVEGIEFRSVTVIAYKGKEGACFDHKEAVIYQGPFSSVSDDDGHRYPRGERVAVCRKTFDILTRAPYAGHFIAVEPHTPVREGEAPEFPCTGGVLLRHPRETKGADYNASLSGSAPACGPSGCC